MKIHGEYLFTLSMQTMFQNVQVPIYQHHNLITNNGVLYFLNRLINDDYGRINAIALGSGDDAPSKKDTALKNEKIRSTPNTKIEDNTIKLTSVFNSVDINGTTEIGVFVDDTILVSRDVYTSNITIPSNATIALTYKYTINTGEEIKEWAKYLNHDYVYTAVNYTEPTSIIEDNTSGYVKRSNIEEVNTKQASWYYDPALHTIYIHCSDNAAATSHQINVIY